MLKRNRNDNKEDNESRQSPILDFVFGPFSKIDHIIPFDTISKKCILLPDAYLEAKEVRLNSQQQILYRLLTMAQHTSYATLNLASWGLVVPALALNRVRLEQVIISSYLINEDKDKGIGPFLKHMGVGLYLNVEKAISDPLIRLLLSEEINVQQARQSAIDAMVDLNPEFDLEKDKFQRKWTTLQLREMAKRRDEITASMHPISNLSLETFYLTSYQILNSAG